MGRSINRALAIAFAVILLVMVVATAIVVTAGVYTNGFEDTRTHYVTAGGAVVKKNGGAQLSLEGDTAFELKGAGFKYADWGEYDIKIVANPASRLEFTAGGQPCKYADIDFTEYFEIRKESNAFTIAEGDYSIITLLEKLYGDVEIIPPTSKLTMPYAMTVTSESGAAVTVYLDYVIEPTGIEIAPSGGIVAG